VFCSCVCCTTGGSWSHKLRKLLLCCSGSSKTVLAAAKDAAFPPKQRHQLEGLKGRLKDAFNTAEKHGAFTYAQQLPWGLPRLYIRHPGLWQEVTDKLHKVAADPSLQGVLITGARGMGKSTLARDVALSFQQGMHCGLEGCEYVCTDGLPTEKG